MTKNVAKVKLDKQQLKAELNLPSQAEILAALVVDTEIVLFVKHPALPGSPADEQTLNVSLDSIRALEVT